MTTPDGLVLDSSAALSLLLDEPGTSTVRGPLLAAAGGSMLVLDLFWLEVVNVLVRRHGWDPDAVVEAIRELDELGVETIAVDRPLLLTSLDLASSHDLTAYDAAHLALAEIADVPLLTLDTSLARAAGARSAIHPGPGTREERAPYGDAKARPDWTRHGRHLAELRRAAGA